MYLETITGLPDSDITVSPIFGYLKTATGLFWSTFGVTGPNLSALAALTR